MPSNIENIPVLGPTYLFLRNENNRSLVYISGSAIVLAGMPFYPVSVLTELPFIIVFAAVLVVHTFKLFFRTGSAGKLTHKSKSRNDIYNLRKKEEANEESFSPIFMNIGFIVSILVTLLAFNWTTYDKVAQLRGDVATPDEMQVEPPQTQHKKKKPPPPKVQEIEEVEEEEIEEEPEIQETEITEDMAIEAPEPKEETQEQEVFSIVEDMPEFPGGEEKLMEYIYKNINYPQMAKENNVQGLVVVKFVVSKDGSVRDGEILRDIGGSCGEEAVRVVKTLPDFEPGKQRGKPVPVYYKLPIRFELQ
jgi:protein TonB